MSEENQPEQEDHVTAVGAAILDVLRVLTVDDEYTITDVDDREYTFKSRVTMRQELAATVMMAELYESAGERARSVVAKYKKEYLSQKVGDDEKDYQIGMALAVRMVSEFMRDEFICSKVDDLWASFHPKDVVLDEDGNRISIIDRYSGAEVLKGVLPFFARAASSGAATVEMFMRDESE